MRRLHTDREKDRSNFAFSQLENEREKRHLRDGLEAASRETALLKDQLECLVLDNKNMLRIIEHDG